MVQAVDLVLIARDADVPNCRPGPGLRVGWQVGCRPRLDPVAGIVRRVVHTGVSAWRALGHRVTQTGDGITRQRVLSGSTDPVDQSPTRFTGS